MADGLLSVLDNTLILTANSHLLSVVSGIVTIFTALITLLVFVLMALTPMIPKRFFWPITLFNPLVTVAAIPFTLVYWDRLVEIDLATGILQLVFGLLMLAWMNRGLRFRPPFFMSEQLGEKRFSWGNLFGFVVVHLFLLLPLTLVYLGWCGSKAVDHLSDGFLALHHDRFAVRAREYARADGKIIHLVPMMHIGESRFYDQIVKSIPSNAAVMLEGVSDEKNLLERKLNYKKMAGSLGLTEQHDNFSPEQAKLRNADIDVEQFSKRSLGFLKLVTRIHTEDLNPVLIQQMMEQSKDPELMKTLWADLLTRRNEHLLEEIVDEMKETDVIVVPWGAAHMPTLAKDIQKLGFKQTREEEFTIFHYRTLWRGEGKKKPAIQ